MTKYHVCYRVYATREVKDTAFDSMLARALFVISMGVYADILELWESL